MFTGGVREFFMRTFVDVVVLLCVILQLNLGEDLMPVKSIKILR